MTDPAEMFAAAIDVGDLEGAELVLSTVLGSGFERYASAMAECWAAGDVDAARRRARLASAFFPMEVVDAG